MIPADAVEAAAAKECAHCIDEYMIRMNRAAIATIEELEALPFESVIRDAEGHVLERWGGPDEYFWVTVMVPNFIPPAEITLPATVLHRPTR